MGSQLLVWRSMFENRRTLSFAPSLIAALCWGAMFPIAASAIKHVDPYTLTAVRYGIAALVFMAQRAHARETVAVTGASHMVMLSHPDKVAQLIEDDDYWPPDGEEAFYQEDVGYERSDFALSTHGELWRQFCQDILHRQRFFNLKACNQLKDIFDGIHLQRSRDGRPWVTQGDGGGVAVFLDTGAGKGGHLSWIDLA